MWGGATRGITVLIPGDGVVDEGKDCWSKNGNIPSPGAAGLRIFPGGQLSPRADSLSPGYSATVQ